MSDRLNFLYPKYPYHGEFTPSNLVFNANLQEFAHRVGYICALETGGKLTPEESYQHIRLLWKDLKSSAKSLGVNKKPLQDNDSNS
jgi:hypothetical protein